MFERPDYQDRVRSVVGASRGIPDVSLSAALSGAVDFWFTLPTPAGPAGGWSLAGGTSEATLCLSACATRTPVLLPVAGYTATKGYDLASELGTVDAAELVDALR